MYPTHLARPKQIRTALTLYRVLAIIAGVALFVLIAAMLVKYFGPRNGTFSSIWSPIHGVLYMAYAAAIANLGTKVGWDLKRIVLNLLTGFVPVLPFIAERRNTAQVQAMLQRQYFAADGSTDGAGGGRR